MKRAFNLVRNVFALLGVVFAVMFAAGWLQAREEAEFIDLDDEGHRAGHERMPTARPRGSSGVPAAF